MVILFLNQQSYALVLYPISFGSFSYVYSTYGYKVGNSQYDGRKLYLI